MQVSNASTKHKHQTQALNASIKHKYQTQVSNATSNGGDASRVGKKMQFLFSRFFHYPDARRVAPISA